MLSAHRRMELIGAVNRGPDRVRQLEGAVLLRYGKMLVSVAKATGEIGMPFDRDERAFLASIGVAERAREAMRKGEGITPAPDYSKTPGRLKIEAARRRFRLVD